MKNAQLDRWRRCSTGPCPTWAVLAARRAHPQLVAAPAAGPDRRGARRPGRGDRARRARHGLRRRGHDRGRRRRHGLRHLGRGRRRRLPGHAARRRGDTRPAPRHGHRDRHGERVRARHARRARVRRQAPGRPVAARPGRRGGQGGRDHVRAGGQRQHRAVDRLERGPRPRHRQALRAGVAHPGAHERRHGRGRRADDGATRRPTPPRAWLARCVECRRLDGL